MYFWNKYPFVRIVTFFILGIVAFDTYPTLWKHAFVTVGVSLTVFFFAVLLAGFKGFFYRLRHVHGILAFTCIFLIAGLLTGHKYHSLEPSHYLKVDLKYQAFSGTIESYPNERTNYHRYEFELSKCIFSTDSITHMTGKIYLYIWKDSLAPQLKYGDQLLVRKHLFPISGPGNPEEFDFQHYLARKEIYSHAFIDQKDFLHIGTNPGNSVLAAAFRLRTIAAETLQKHFPNAREQGIAEALLLGIKDNLEKDIKRIYATAGAMHVLAVSGLHVGIIYLLIRLLFGKIANLGKRGRFAFATLSILCIWFYAMVTGMSPSVLRAATMFSLVAITQATTRESNIYNTLGFTAFVLLTFDPYLIYNVGFQLSFAAVFGIVYFQPRFYGLFTFENKILDKIWMISCVSLAAQLATFPLTAYYFHQFPTYFLLSNLIVIPAAFLFLVGGIALILLEMLLPVLASFLGALLNKFLQLINHLISYIESLPMPMVDRLYIDLPSVLFTYLIFLTFITAIQYRLFKTFALAVILCFSLLAHNFHSHYRQSTKKQLLIYQTDDVLAIDQIEGHRAQLFLSSNAKDKKDLLEYQINPFRLASSLSPISESSRQLSDSNFLRNSSVQMGILANHRIAIFDSTTFHLEFLQKTEVDLLIIQNESVKSLQWLKKWFQTKQIVLGSGNSWYYIEKMKKEAALLQLNIHSTKTDGALILSL